MKYLTVFRKFKSKEQICSAINDT